MERDGIGIGAERDVGEIGDVNSDADGDVGGDVGGHAASFDASVSMLCMMAKPAFEDLTRAALARSSGWAGVEAAKPGFDGTRCPSGWRRAVTSWT